MSRIYGEQNRALQMAFDTRTLADRIEQIAVKPGIDEMAKAFIECRDMAFVTTIDHQGRPTVSYKGGLPGFIRVLDDSTLAFPSYDGNGMYLTAGNLTANPEIGMLFIDFERPFRLRLQGRAEVVMAGPEVEMFPEAEMAVVVRVHETWMNCPRYVHRYAKVAHSRYAPGAQAETPFCEWKRIDALQDVVRSSEREKVAEIGTTTIDDWMAKVVTGDDQA